MNTFTLFLTSGIGAFNPGIFKLGYDGGGPYLCMAINHGGGTSWLLGPIGIPRAVRSSSDKSPGFFSFNFVSNSFPWLKKRGIRIRTFLCLLFFLKPCFKLTTFPSLKKIQLKVKIMNTVTSVITPTVCPSGGEQVVRNSCVCNLWFYWICNKKHWVQILAHLIIKFPMY